MGPRDHGDLSLPTVSSSSTTLVLSRHVPVSLHDSLPGPGILCSYFLAFAHQVPSAWETHSLSTWLILFTVQPVCWPHPQEIPALGPRTVSGTLPRCSQPGLPAENEDTQLKSNFR